MPTVKQADEAKKNDGEVPINDTFIRSLESLATLSFYQSAFFSWDFILFVIWRVPLYAIVLIRGTLLALYTTFINVVLPKDPDIVRFILNTTLSMHVSRLGDEGTSDRDLFEAYKLTFHDCLLESAAGDRLECMELIFSLHRDDIAELKAIGDPLRQHRHSCINFCTINRKPVSDRGLIMGTINVFLDGRTHPKIHTAAAPLIRFIKEHSIGELQPCLVGTRPLHTALLRTPFSPIADNKWLTGSWMYTIPFTVRSLVNDSKNWVDFRHDGLVILHDVSPLCSFLWIARRACLRQVRRNVSHEGGAPTSANLPSFFAECFFLTTVVHAVDHYNSHKFSWWLKYPLHYNEERVRSWTMRQFYSFTGAVFRYLFEAPILNPLRPHLFKTMPTDSIYGRIYNEIKTANTELADCVTASIIY